MTTNTGTREKILTAAFDLASNIGIDVMTRDQVAIHAGVALGNVSNHFKNMGNLRHAVMRKAIQCEQLNIIATGLARGDSVACEAPEELKRRALETLV